MGSMQSFYSSLPQFYILFSVSEIVGFRPVYQILLCPVQRDPLLDVHQLIMLFARTLTYLEPTRFSLIIFCN
jgi:hypothetical protein